MTRLRLSALALLLPLATSPGLAQSFEGLGDLPGGSVSSTATGVSADGSVVVGVSNGAGGTSTSGNRLPFRWEDGEMVQLPIFDSPFTDYGTPTGITADGTVISGVSSDNTPNGNVPVRWVDGEIERLPVSIAKAGGAASDVTRDGSVFVGTGIRFSGGEQREAFRLENGVTQGLGYGPGANFSYASAVSDDGSTIVGGTSEFINEGFVPYVWRNGALQLLLLPGTVAGGDASDVSADGSVIVGTATEVNGNINDRRAIRWVDDVPTLLPAPPSRPRAFANAVSADGSVVAGGAFDTNFQNEVAWIWTDADGTRDLRTVLVDLGLNLSGWQLTRAIALSPDGTVVVGEGINPAGDREAWRAVLVPGQTIVVNETGDEPNHPDSQSAELCDVDRDMGGDQCTLRAALELANARDGRDEIEFDLDGSGPFVLAPASPLPSITEDLFLDGSTQPGTGTVPLIRLDGAGAGADTDGLVVEADGVTLRGLVITRFGRHGVHVASGDNGALEGLIVGTDANGTDGLGNGGDGIHVSGGTGLSVGRDEDAPGRPATAINLGNIVAGNLLNGLYVRNEDNAALIRAMRAGAISRAETQRININVNGLTAGVVDLLGGAVARPNGQNGVCFRGVDGAVIQNLFVSDAARNALEIDASRNIQMLSGLFGVRRENPTISGLIGSIGGSLIKLTQSINVTIGSGDPNEAPIQGVGAGGWFMDVEESEQVEVRNLLGGLTSNLDGIGGILGGLRNLAGGLRISNSPDVTVGMEGVSTVFANNGGDDTQAQAGILALGSLTTSLRILATHLGTTPEGMMGVGNMGSGMVLQDGISDAEIGGLPMNQAVVSGGNMGYGFLFQDLTPEAAGLSGKEAINFVNATRLLSGLFGDGGGQTMRVPNGRSGFCLNRVQGALLERITAGPSQEHGIEIRASNAIQLLSAQIGSLFGSPTQSADDVAGPDGDGIRVENSERISIGRPLEVGSTSSLAPNVFVQGAGGRGLNAIGVQILRTFGLGMGAGRPGSSADPDVLSALGNLFEGIGVEDSDDVTIERATVMMNGAEATSGGGGLFGSIANNLSVLSSVFGEIGTDGAPQNSNLGGAIKVLNSDSLRISLSSIFGHTTGVEVENTTWFAEDNRFEQQGVMGGSGDGIRQTGGILSGFRNLFQGNLGAALRMEGGAAGLMRLNNVSDNAEGFVVDDDGLTAGGAALVATENWWGDASGPGGVGPGSGDTVSEGVDFSDWLTAPRGILAVTDTPVIEFDRLGEDIEVFVRFASPFIGEDNVVVTVTEDRDWTPLSTFVVQAPAGGYGERRLTLRPDIRATNVVTFQAVSATDNTLVGEATITLMPRGTSTALTSGVAAGSTTLPADGEGAFVVGGEVIVNPGRATQERGVITGFGSILLADPLRFAHGPGELVIPANAAAVAGEVPPVPSAEAGGLAVSVHPNPTRGTGSVRLAGPTGGEVRASVFDALGREIAVLHEGALAAGYREVTVPRLAPGIYLVRLVSGTETAVVRLTVVR